MRVISGKYKGKKLEGFDIEGTRPTMDRVKESLMAMIQNYIPDAVCLDLFAGSGSLGIEALSNGAKSCCFCDNNPKLIEIIKRNTQKMDDDIKIINTDYAQFLNETNIKYDLIFLDPPYKFNLINECLKLIKKNDLLSSSGILVLEYEGENIDSLDYKIIKQKKYGSKNIMILKNTNDNIM